MSELHVLPLKRIRRGEVDLVEADLQAMLDRTLAQLADRLRQSERLMTLREPSVSSTTDSTWSSP